MNGLNNLKRNNMEKEFVTYDQALALKELGFEEQCLSYFIDENHLKVPHHVYEKNSNLEKRWCLAPLKQQAFNFFRDKHNLYSWTMLHDGYIDDDFNITYKIMDINGNWYYCDKYFERTKTGFNGLYKSYEEAESACIDKLIEIIKEK